jgi:hypothetical protein
MQGASSIPISDLLKRGLSIVKAGAGQSMFQHFVGSLALPVVDDLHRREMKILEEDDDPQLFAGKFQVSCSSLSGTSR